MFLLADNKEERLSVCKTCSSYDAERDKCKQCGCNMALKTMYINSECPLKLWGCLGCLVR
jgi:hypothetical protein